MGKGRKNRAGAEREGSYGTGRTGGSEGGCRMQGSHSVLRSTSFPLHTYIIIFILLRFLCNGKGE